MNMLFKRKLPIPMELKEMYPMSMALEEAKHKRDEEIKAIFDGRSDRFLLVIGPCSADSADAMLEYAHRLAVLQEKTKDKLLLVPRVYTNKPRTVGDGYKGMLHQPDPEKDSDLWRGIISIRKLHMDVLRETGLSTADEMLYPENHRYLSDLLSYVAVGARSSEDQQHRLTASGLDIPCGMKNPTSGDLSILMNSITAAQHPHAFIYRGWEVESTGNPYAHAILRGYVSKHGESHPNYHYEDLELTAQLYAEKKLVNPAVLVDTNHANSGKQYAEQIRIAKEVLHSRRYSEQIRKLVKGLMIESYLEDGAQKIGEHVYGKSITDPCLGWESTERLLLDLAEAL